MQLLRRYNIRNDENMDIYNEYIGYMIVCWYITFNDKILYFRYTESVPTESGINQQNN